PDSFIRSTLQFYIENAFEYGTVLHQSLEVQRARYDVDSLTAFQVRARELERQGRGLVVLGGHLGNTEHMSYPLVCVGMPVAALYSRSRQPALENAILRLRSQWGLDMCPADLSGVRRLYTCLRRGGMVAMLADQRPGRRVQRAYAPFLGCEGLSPAILPELIRRTGCAVLAMAVIRGEGGRLEVIYNEVDEAIADPDDEVAVTAQNDAISRLISRAPEQYFWHYRRFTRRRVEPRNPYKD
ncbi:MAG: lysophospholipid acyltransferase family protein, partial [Gammaproteobacteria bacterium AqS3]|nr:lysophospholipid acyltransferase family protein [Gammaproteobacteria bacterium AqS3]